MKGIIVAAPFSGSGKTVVTLGLIRALADRGVAVSAAKAGPDYIDAAFQSAAARAPCVNLDPWAMRTDLLRGLANKPGADALLVVEAMMGLFDGAADGTGSAADLSALLKLPVVFVVDCARLAQSIAALVTGYRDHRDDVAFAGVVLNRVGSPRHERMLRTALEPTGVPVLGVIPGSSDLSLPSRHLGLVQASEIPEREAVLEKVAALVAAHCDLDAIAAAAGGQVVAATMPPVLAPPGQRVAIARDEAFGFSYNHMLDGWRSEGAELTFFSPLADEGPAADADAVFLPGGYPELHAARLADAHNFLDGLRAAAKRDALVYGECGGYMVLGEILTDGQGDRHEMAGLLPLETSYAKRKRHLGYRRLTPKAGSPWRMALAAHEFHYSTIVREGAGEPIFAASDAEGTPLGDAGLRVGNVCGSFMHVIDREV